MKTSTKTVVTHRTKVSSEAKATDGGRALLLELFDDVHGDKREGVLTATFGPGGSVRSLVFEETEEIAQSDIAIEGVPV